MVYKINIVFWVIFVIIEKFPNIPHTVSLNMESCRVMLRIPWRINLSFTYFQDTVYTVAVLGYSCLDQRLINDNKKILISTKKKKKHIIRASPLMKCTFAFFLFKKFAHHQSRV